MAENVKVHIVEKMVPNDGDCGAGWIPIKVFRTHSMAEAYVQEQAYPSQYDIEEIDGEGF